MNLNPIAIRNHSISPIVTSTIMGHSGGGMLPLSLDHEYRWLMRVIMAKGVTNFTKSSTWLSHRGNFRLFNPLTWKYVQRLGRNGLLNAYGLTNRGVEVNARKIASAMRKGFRVIPSLYPQFAQGQTIAIVNVLVAIKSYGLNLGPSFWALELNFSCPNAKEKIAQNIADALACVEAVRMMHPSLCLIAKISIVHPYEFAQELIKAGVDIIHAINTIPYDLIYPYGPPSPLATVGGGGVSGGPIFHQALEYNDGLRKLISAPIIMGGGVMSVRQAQIYFDAGANAVSFCTVGRLNPEEAIKIITSQAA